MKKFDLSLFDELIPIKYLSSKDRDFLSEQINLETYKKGSIIFSQGEEDNNTFYLCSGIVELIASNGSRIEITSGSEDSRYPLSNIQPRQYTARAIVESSVVVIKKDVLDDLSGENARSDCECNDGLVVTDLDPHLEQDWMSCLLGSELFGKIPAHNIQNIFSRIEPVNLECGDEVIHQGDTCEYFYIIKQGKCEVLRRPSENSAPVKMLRLTEGGVFGEESLITGEPSMVTVKMLNPGVLLRLHRDDFNLFICDELVHEIQHDDVDGFSTGNTTFLNVGYPDEAVPDIRHKSINIPFNVLRVEAGKLDRDKEYIVFCGDTLRSKAAVFLLVQHGIKAGYLRRETGISQSALSNVIRIQDMSESELEAGQETSTGSDSYAQIQQQRLLIGELRKELEELKGKFTNGLEQRDDDQKAIKAAEKKAEETIKREYQLIQETMNKALSIYEETREIKEKLLEDRLSLKKVIENQKQRQDEVVHAIEQEARSKIAGELKKIEEFYSTRENQIRQLQKLKKIAEKRLRFDHKACSTGSVRVPAKNSMDARLGILNDSKYREYIRSRKRLETENLARDIGQSSEQLESLSKCGETQSPGRRANIEELNKILKQEYEKLRDDESTPTGMIATEPDVPGDPVNRDIQDWKSERDKYDNSADRLRKLREKREIMRRIYKHAMKQQTLSRIHDKKLISELDSVLDRNEGDDD